MDEWHIDGLVGGSQKAFMLPTGMSFFAFSKKAQLRFDTAKIARYYFDVRKEKKANEAGETFFSSNVTIIKALNFVLSEIEKKGLETLFAHKRWMFKRTQGGAGARAQKQHLAVLRPRQIAFSKGVDQGFERGVDRYGRRVGGWGIHKLASGILEGAGV